MIVYVDGEVAWHLSTAIGRYFLWARDNGLGPPSELLELGQRLAAVAQATAPASGGQDRGQGRTTPPPRRPITHHGGMTPVLVTPTEAADLLACSPRQVRRLAAGGRLERVKVGGAVRYRRADIEALTRGLDSA